MQRNDYYKACWADINVFSDIFWNKCCCAQNRKVTTASGGWWSFEWSRMPNLQKYATRVYSLVDGVLKHFSKICLLIKVSGNKGALRATWSKRNWMVPCMGLQQRVATRARPPGRATVAWQDCARKLLKHVRTVIKRVSGVTSSCDRNFIFIKISGIAGTYCVSRKL